MLIEHYLNQSNLTQLWTAMAEAYDSFGTKDPWAYALIPESEWPNRIWATETWRPEDMKDLEQFLAKGDYRPTLSLFEVARPEQTMALRQGGWEPSTTQYGMIRALKQAKFEVVDNLETQLVENKEQAALWSSIFEQAFGYHIAPAFLLTKVPQLSSLLLIQDQKAVGTLMFYETGKVVGFHSMGIAPEARGQGLATKAMALLLRQQQAKGKEQAVLQASNMAKGLYEKLGFEHQFIMRNYRQQ